MADYKKYINALRKCAKEHENDRTSTGHIIVSDLCRDTANLLEKLEQEPKTGHWISDKNGQYCDKCGNGIKTPYNFCPFCGADMREYTSEIRADSEKE